MPKRESVYAWALLAGVPIISYDRDAQTLTVPFRAPIPEKFARAACLCSGDVPELSYGRLLYHDVPLDIAAVLMAELGHPRPLCDHPLLLRKRVDE